MVRRCWHSSAVVAVCTDTRFFKRLQSVTADFVYCRRNTQPDSIRHFPLFTAEKADVSSHLPLCFCYGTRRQGKFWGHLWHLHYLRLSKKNRQENNKSNNNCKLVWGDHFPCRWTAHALRGRHTTFTVILTILGLKHIFKTSHVQYKIQNLLRNN